MNSQGSNEFWEEFINLYRQFPCLWDVKSKHYADRNLRNAATEKLVEKCKTINPQANKEFVVKKIHNFRCGFRREQKKIKQSKTTGASSDDIYVPSLWYYDIISFIADTEIPRKGVDTMDSDSRDTEINSEEVSKCIFSNIVY